MNLTKEYFSRLLTSQTHGVIGTEIPALTEAVAKKLKNRIENITLYLHSYTLYKNFFYGHFTLVDFLDFAYWHDFKGISLNTDTGRNPLQTMTDDEISQVGEYADSLCLPINIDISSTNDKEFSRAVHIANILQAKNIRFYIRESGSVSDIINNAVLDIRKMADVAKKNNLFLLLEQHEDLKSVELVEIVGRVNADNLGILFDYGNMVNANEKPLEALQTMAPLIKQVHVKGVKILKEGEGFGHVGVCEKDDDLPHAKLMFDLLMLGDQTPQVNIFYLEEVNDYYAPAYRFENEGTNPHIPERTESITKSNELLPLEEMLRNEKKDACAQMHFIGSLLTELKTIANIALTENRP